MARLLFQSIGVLFGLTLVVGCGGGAEPEAPAAAEETGSTATEPTDKPGATPGELPPASEVAAALEAEPDNYQLRHLLAVTLHRENRREEALAQFEKVVEQKPDTAYIIELAIAYASVSRMEESEAAFRRALESDVDNPVVLYHLGNLAQRRGDTSQAVSLYRQAIESDPQHLLAHFQLGESLRLAGQLEQAYRNYETVVGLTPSAPAEVASFDAALFHLATIDLQMGATERAVQFLKLLVQIRRDHPQAHLLLGQALSKLGRQDEAREALAEHQRIAAAQAAPESAER